jgi:glucokinase-like ROK family protein
MSQAGRYRTGNQALMREMNLSVIMHHLREHAPISRAALAEMTGLNKTTVSSLVSELIEQEFVRELGLTLTGSGRPATLLELNPAAGYIVSAEIGVDFISAICTNFAVEVIWRHKESTRRAMGRAAMIDRTLTLLRHAVEAGRTAHCNTFLGLAVGVPGLVDQASGNLLFAPNIGWKDVPLRTILREAFDAPVFINNEANMAALGEVYFGAAQGHDEVLYISAGVGLGGGLVRGGQLCDGATGFAGEFGHMTMDPDGEPCNCGNRGCWETQVSQWAIFRDIRLAISQGRASLLSDMAGGDLDRLTVPLVVEAARAGDGVALETFETVGRYLGIGIASLMNALNPDLVVLGGSLSLASEFLLPAVHQELERRALRWSRSAAQVVPARHGFDACVMGGVATVYHAVLAQPSNITRVDRDL